MINTLIFDFARVILVPKEQITGSLESFHKGQLEQENYSLFDSLVLNDQLLGYLEKIKSQYDLYVFTTSNLQNEPGVSEKVSPHFKHIFSTEEIGFSKKDPQSFAEVLKRINKDPKEVIFIDDTLKNIEAAQSIGIRTIHFKNNQQLFEELSTHLHLN